MMSTFCVLLFIPWIFMVINECSDSVVDRTTSIVSLVYQTVAIVVGIYFTIRIRKEESLVRQQLLIAIA